MSNTVRTLKLSQTIDSLLPDGSSGACLCAEVVADSTYTKDNLTIDIQVKDYDRTTGVTFSIYAMSTKTVNAVFNVCGDLDLVRNDDLSYDDKYYDRIITNDWTRISKYAEDPVSNIVKISLSPELKEGDKIYFYKAQLELGSEASSWVAPDDQVVSKNYLKARMELDDEGLHIGNYRDTNEVFIDSDSVDIRRGSDTVASFCEDGVKFMPTESGNWSSEFRSDRLMIGNYEIRLVDSDNKGGIMFSYTGRLNK